MAAATFKADVVLPTPPFSEMNAADFIKSPPQQRISDEAPHPLRTSSPEVHEPGGLEGRSDIRAAGLRSRITSVPNHLGLEGPRPRIPSVL